MFTQRPWDFFLACFLHFSSAEHGSRFPCARSKLHEIARTDDINQVKGLLKAGEDINSSIEGGPTPLHYAVYCNRLEMVKFLVENGANLEHKMGMKMTPLHLALDQKYPEIIEYLVEKGASLNARNYGKKSALHKACTFECPIEILKLMIDKGANIDQRTTDGRTPLHIAAQYESLGVFKYLLEQGAKVNAKVSKGITALHIALYTDRLDFVRALLDKGAYFNAKVDSPTGLYGTFRIAENQEILKLLATVIDLFGSVFKDDARKTKQLLRDKCIVNARECSTGNASLHLAKSVQVVKCLLEHGAMYNLRNNHGQTPSDISTNENVIKLLKSVDELFKASKNGDEGLTEKLDSLEEDLSRAVRGARNDQGKTILQEATSFKLENTSAGVSQSP